MAELAKQEPASAPATISLEDYTVPPYLVDEVELAFDLEQNDTRVSSRLKIRKNPHSADSGNLLKLDGSHQQLESVVLDGETLSPSRYSLSDEALEISAVPAQFTLQIVSRINPAANTALEGLYHSGSLLCTQCEAEGFRRITYFPDRPDVMARYTVTLRGDKQQYPVLLANGNLVAQGDNDDGTHWATWNDPSLKPCYLFAIVAGQLAHREDSFTTLHGRAVTLRLYVEPENIHKCDHAMNSLQQAMQWDEQTYGREYDLDIYMVVAVNDFNMGAMENKGLNIFNASCVLASPETATDGDYYSIQSIIGHEYFHNWSGNRVTCRDWFQLSLKEGFTVYRDQEFSADLNSRGVKRIDDVDVLRTHQFAQDAGPMAHPIRPAHYMEISNFYTVTVYNKGAEVVRMIRNLVSEEGFRKGTDLYFERHDGQAVTTEDFVKAMEDANGCDLAQFQRWYHQAGTPQVQVQQEYDAATQVFTLILTQTCPPTPDGEAKLPFHIPLAIGLLDSGGKDLPLQLQGEETSAAQTTRMISLRETQQSLQFINIPCDAVLSLGRGFSAPVKIHSGHDEQALAFLLAHDSDDFNRWDAGQQLALKILLRLIEDKRSGITLQVQQTFIDAMGQALSNAAHDPALFARILTLPAESYIADQMAVVDVEAIHAARQFLRRQLAIHLESQLLEIYQHNRSDAAYRFCAEDMARRSLKNVALSYLVLLDKAPMTALCMEQYHQGDNMTDVIAALSCLVNMAVPERDQALDDFYQRWQHDPQVVEKWFALQAGSVLPGTLSQVKALMQHAAFSLQNPNKVRSLIGRFCHANPLHFHASDGSGYAFLTQQVLILDAMNPQITARLVQSLSRWRRFDASRQQLMRQQLERIVAHEGLSKDVYEVASKCLQ